mmetsp:Transcript_12728/g.35810  ORF Transcript_12728/g.35810 Transcript_12728/m.35810 type:complete len:243 (-) Transcript_12728:330-1058(-)|eukprot:CAMPEP_0117662504 /NCGR_PEP_ID=MMETSP0804-20121206/8086_1 /TAXON_ID=1074897 /ORGANISM="Tetraselmis astigmatica, Strain CCMP880" /LENGTH=242 /DNA_ID=CAMNT_0005469403 /DNA_START=261 /DNA_END=989 /DNA_ORIENTATION=-
MPTFEEEKQAAKLDAPGKVEMTVGGRNIPIQEMTPEDVGKWLDDQGLGDLSSAFVRHKITGRYLVLLTQTDLEKMGIDLIGDQKAVLEELAEVKRAARRVLRDQILWAGKEKVFDNCCQELCSTCCFLCPIPPARYTLTNQALKITDVDICRCFGSIRCTLCGVQTKQNNIDLNYVKDVDFQVHKSCCIDNADIVIETDFGESESTKILKIHGPDAPEVVTLIKNAMEDAKMRRERGAKGDF